MIFFFFVWPILSNNKSDCKKTTIQKASQLKRTMTIIQDYIMMKASQSIKCKVSLSSEGDVQEQKITHKQQ